MEYCRYFLLLDWKPRMLECIGFLTVKRLNASCCHISPVLESELLQTVSSFWCLLKKPKCLLVEIVDLDLKHKKSQQDFKHL